MTSPFNGNSSERTALLSEVEHDGQAPFYGPPNSDYTPAASSTSLRQHRIALVLLGIGLIVGSFTQSFDLAFLITNYNRRIASDLSGLGNTAWIVLAGSVSESASQPLYSHVALSRGVQVPLLVAVWLCAQGLLSCSLWSNLWALVLSRTVVGLGKSGLSFLTVIIISDLVSVTEIPLWRSGVLATGTLAEISGGPLGSSIASRFGWRATFGVEYAMMLLCCCFVTASFVFARSVCINLLPPSPDSKRQSFDALGALTLPLAVIVPLMAIGLGGETLPWNHPVEIAMVCLSPLLLTLFCWVESLAASPIIPMRFVKNKDVLVVMAAAVGAVFAYNSVIFNLALYIDIQNASFIREWAMSLVFAARPVGAVLAGIVIKKSRRFKRLLLADLVVLTGLYCALALTSLTTGVTAYISLLASIGFAMGIAENCLVAALFSAVDKRDQPPLYATFDLSLAFVADIAITVSNAFMRSTVRLRLSGDPEVTDEIIRKSLSSLDYIRSLPEELSTRIFDALASSIRGDYFLASGLILLSLAGAVNIKDIEG